MCASRAGCSSSCAIEELILRGNAMTRCGVICRVFEQLGVVEVLILRGNAFTELPPSTWQLSSLRALDLSDNRLAALPPDIAGLQQLQVPLLEYSSGLLGPLGVFCGSAVMATRMPCACRVPHLGY